MSCFRIGAAAAMLLLAGSAAIAAPQAYSLRLLPVARTNTNRLSAVGNGTADVAIDGSKLTLNGKFNGLASPATEALLCSGAGIGVAGVCTPTNLVVSKGVQGTLTGTITLSSQQLALLPQGRLYVQLNSEKAPAPTGNLWGWIMFAHEEPEQDVPQPGHGFLPQYDMPLSVEHGSTHPLTGEKNS